MKLLALLMAFAIIDSYKEPIQVALERSSYVTRSGTEPLRSGKRFTMSGANVYWIGLNENRYPTKGRITQIMNTMRMLGAHVIQGHTLGESVVMPELGNVNEQVFGSIDLYRCVKFVFPRWRGINSTSTGTIDTKVQEFNRNPQVVTDFKNSFKVLLTHVNLYTGLTYNQNPTVFVHETGNELGVPNFPRHVSLTTCTFGARHRRSLWSQPDSSKYPYHRYFSNHFYPPNNMKLANGIAMVESANKRFALGELFGAIKSQQAKSKPVSTQERTVLCPNI
ncbi:glycoside hydrolase family 5 protein [Lepidopterella palustris CBS 459.81]|uniref:Glycoside hydrolase family 5 protein n=1 Tax=Lepidopterella palustris CBS 459.81 TaxID=1314670 RepID=A0A8E2EFW6_9PEZI|nr:glycoside hydrolase family 5 protein [Lepidopterella palustris CBS 459.81]